MLQINKIVYRAGASHSALLRGPRLPSQKKARKRGASGQGWEVNSATREILAYRRGGLSTTCTHPFCVCARKHVGSINRGQSVDPERERMDSIKRTWRRAKGLYGA